LVLRNTYRPSFSYGVLIQLSIFVRICRIGALAKHKVFFFLKHKHKNKIFDMYKLRSLFKYKIKERQHLCGQNKSCIVVFSCIVSIVVFSCIVSLHVVWLLIIFFRMQFTSRYSDFRLYNTLQLTLWLLFNPLLHFFVVLSII
jgi:hypothetical protein